MTVAAWRLGEASGLWTRVATAAVSVPVFVVVVVHAPSWVFDGMVLVLAAVASWELSRLYAQAGRWTYRWLGVAAGSVVTASFLVPGGPVPALTVAILVVVSVPIWTRRAPSAEPAALALLGLAYVSWLLGHGVLLHRLPDGPMLVLFLVGVTWTGETTAYLVGSVAGRHKLAPIVSPGKTIEGAVAQLVVSSGAAVALAIWLLPAWSLATALGAGALLGVTGQVGDLAESVIKRSVGAKDTGGLIPGHGGVLDRLDSLLFNVPAIFYFVTWTGLAA